jgi:hypothetical protein
MKWICPDCKAEAKPNGTIAGHPRRTVRHKKTCPAVELGTSRNWIQVEESS